MKRKKISKKSAVRRPPTLMVFGLTVAVAAIFSVLFHPSKPLPCANPGSCDTSLEFHVDNSVTGIFENRRVSVPPINLTDEPFDTRVHGIATASGEKHIYVDLTKQMLYAYDGDSLFMQTPISSGKWFPTPTGDFTIWYKIRSTRMTGGEGADYYDLPNVPYVMFFYNNEVAQSRGFSLHGAYWHNNFGHMMSHGCINMRQIDAEKLYYWALPVATDNTVRATSDHPGTQVTIYKS